MCNCDKSMFPAWLQEFNVVAIAIATGFLPSLLRNVRGMGVHVCVKKSNVCKALNLVFTGIDSKLK